MVAGSKNGSSFLRAEYRNRAPIDISIDGGILGLSICFQQNGAVVGLQADGAFKVSRQKVDAAIVGLGLDVTCNFFQRNGAVVRSCMQFAGADIFQSELAIVCFSSQISDLLPGQPSA